MRHEERDPRLAAGLERLLRDPVAFSDIVLPDRRLRGYQRDPARAIAGSVLAGDGRQFALVFSRQAGKDELLAQLLAWILVRSQRRGGSAVVACPAFSTQATLSRDRLLARLWADRSIHLAGRPRLRDGAIVEVGRASVRFLSAAPRANARGQTADLLLVANEAQDIDPAVWDAVFDPMAASTNATTVFAGTTWSRAGLLSRQMRHLEAQERADGARRVWRVPWDVVAADLPPYGERVRARIAQFGPEHPFIRTEYRLEELEGDGLLFPPERRVHLIGDHPRRRRAQPGERYALLIDVAGEEVGASGWEHPPGASARAYPPGAGGRRDSTALTVVAVDPGDEGTRYRVVDRRVWTGLGQAALQPQIADLARSVWRASAIVIDATGIGAGLASVLGRTFRRGQPAAPASGRVGRVVAGHPGQPIVVPFTFTAASKSALGWSLVALIESGRLKDYAADGDAVTRRFQDELAGITHEVVAGPGHRLRWGVPPGRGHDDLVMSLALVSVLEAIDWRPRLALGTERQPATAKR